MTNIAVITGADRGLGFALTEGLIKEGWVVFAGQYMPAWTQLAALCEKFPDHLHIIPLDVSSSESVQAAARAVAEKTDHIDLLINNAGITSPANTRPIRERQDYADMHRLYDTNTLASLRMVEAFITLLDRGTTRRLCFVSSEAGSIGRATRRSWFSYCMSKAALNMAVKLLFNDLRPDGYTFRLYHPGWMRTYMSGTKSLEADMEPEVAAANALPFFIEPRVDENTLALVDYNGNEWPW
jgi:NAD(P)-dependent dehydrogenase (short-subunit alcohol dehydrogenase family)